MGGLAEGFSIQPQKLFQLEIDAENLWENRAGRLRAKQQIQWSCSMHSQSLNHIDYTTTMFTQSVLKEATKCNQMQAPNAEEIIFEKTDINEI